MTTAADWVEDARGYLDGGQVPIMNVLDADYTPGDTTLAFRYDLGGITSGRVLSVGLACFMVLEVDTNARTATIRAGWAGADDVACTSNDVVLVNPRYTTHRVFNMLNRSLLEMSSKGLYAVDQLELQVDPTQDVYDLSAATGLLDVLNVMVAEDTDDLTDRRPTLPEGTWQFRRIAPTTEFPTGAQIRFFDIEYQNDATATVTYKRTFLPLTDLTTNITVSLVDEAMADIPPLGAASKLGGSQEMRRNQLTAQGDTRRADEVPVGAVLSGSREIRRMYQERITDELGRLMQAYPPSFRS